MNIVRIGCIIILGLSIASCSLLIPPPAINLQKTFDGKDIAILDFSATGMQFSQRHGVMTADRLTTALLLNKKFTLIERARVRDAQKIVGVSSVTPVSADQIQKIGLRLNAKYLVIGEIYQYAKENGFSSEGEGTVTISFRVLNTANGEIAGVVTHSLSYSEQSPEEVINRLIEQISKKLAMDSN